MSLIDRPDCGLPAEILDRFALNGTSGPVAHVKARCPALIATLVAIARAATEDPRVDISPAPRGELLGPPPASDGEQLTAAVLTGPCGKTQQVAGSRHVGSGQRTRARVGSKLEATAASGATAFERARPVRM